MRESVEQLDFENYLKDVHYDSYPELLDDDIPDHFDNWVSGLTLDELEGYSRRMCLIPHRRIAEEYYKEHTRD